MRKITILTPRLYESPNLGYTRGTPITRKVTSLGDRKTLAPCYRKTLHIRSSVLCEFQSPVSVPVTENFVNTVKSKGFYDVPVE